MWLDRRRPPPAICAALLVLTSWGKDTRAQTRAWTRTATTMGRMKMKMMKRTRTRRRTAQRAKLLRVPGQCQRLSASRDTFRRATRRMQRTLSPTRTSWYRSSLDASQTPSFPAMFRGLFRSCRHLPLPLAVSIRNSLVNDELPLKRPLARASYWQWHCHILTVCLLLNKCSFIKTYLDYIRLIGWTFASCTFQIYLLCLHNLNNRFFINAFFLEHSNYLLEI